MPACDRLSGVAGTPPADHIARARPIWAAHSHPLEVDSRHDNTADRMIADLESGGIDAAFMGQVGNCRIFE